MSTLRAPATVSAGNETLQGMVLHASATKLLFVAARTKIIGQFVRVQFKLGEEWFDLDGVVTGRLGTSQTCRYEMAVSALPASAALRLDEALLLTRESPKREQDLAQASATAPHHPVTPKDFTRSPGPSTIRRMREYRQLYRDAITGS